MRSRPVARSSPSVAAFGAGRAGATLALLWLAWFVGIISLSAARDGLPWGLAPASSVALFFALFLRQVPRKVPPPGEERIRSVPPRYHKALEIAQLASAASSAVILTLGESDLPTIGLVLASLAYVLVAVEVVSRMSSKDVNGNNGEP
jgi:hypothetical protein